MLMMDVPAAMRLRRRCLPSLYCAFTRPSEDHFIISSNSSINKTFLIVRSTYACKGPAIVSPQRINSNYPVCAVVNEMIGDNLDPAMDMDNPVKIS